MAAKVVRHLGLFLRRTLCTAEASCTSWASVSVDPGDPAVQQLLDSLAIPDVPKVLKTKIEPLRVPYYKLLTLEELEKAQEEATEKAQKILKTPPILPLREQRGHVLEVDEGLAGAISHKIIFTETTHHKDNKLRSIVVREPDGVLREATWDERDRMCEVFVPVHGRKMWLPKVLTDEGLTPVLDRLLHADVLDLVAAQCDPQSPDYHRVHGRVFEDIVRRGCYQLLYSTRYFGSLVWHLLTSSSPPRIRPLLSNMIREKLFINASEVIKLYMLCYPDDDTSLQLTAHGSLNGAELVKLFCELSNMLELLPEFEQTAPDVEAAVN